MSQGQTFKKICLDPSNPVFSHGQLYVGLSRVRSFDFVTVVSPTSEILNCVYKKFYEYNTKILIMHYNNLIVS